MIKNALSASMDGSYRRINNNAMFAIIMASLNTVSHAQYLTSVMSAMLMLLVLIRINLSAIAAKTIGLIFQILILVSVNTLLTQNQDLISSNARSVENYLKVVLSVSTPQHLILSIRKLDGMINTPQSTAFIKVPISRTIQAKLNRTSNVLNLDQASFGLSRKTVRDPLKDVIRFIQAV